MSSSPSSRVHEEEPGVEAAELAFAVGLVDGLLDEPRRLVDVVHGDPEALAVLEAAGIGGGHLDRDRRLGLVVEADVVLELQRAVADLEARVVDAERVGVAAVRVGDRQRADDRPGEVLVDAAARQLQVGRRLVCCR